MKTRKKKGQNERESLAPTFHLDVKYEGKIGQSSMDGNMGGNMSGKWKKDGEIHLGGIYVKIVYKLPIWHHNIILMLKNIERYHQTTISRPFQFIFHYNCLGFNHTCCQIT